MRSSIRPGRVVALLVGVALTATFATPATAATPNFITSSAAAAAARPLTNLAHLDFLTDRVAVTDTAAHNTYKLAADPKVGVLWVYANVESDGTFTRVGGGDYNPLKNTYGQGAFDTDDIARAAVVYLRQWQATGEENAKDQAYQLLRGLTYLQTLTGPRAGEVVLWMQPDGTVNPSPLQPDSPNPSDSDASYWLARTLWALGEGYAAFRHADPAFAAFLKTRMNLSVTALQRDVLGRFGTTQIIHGVQVPGWLIVNGADASSEATLGLSAYLQATGDPSARTALLELADGIAEMSAGTTTSWPYRALLPWALSRSDWHAWAANMPAALAAASTALGDKRLLPAAVDDTAGFTAQLLTSTGPVNGLLPTPVDTTQIAYGADARVQGLIAVSTATGRPGIAQLAGIAAGWFFGQNASGAPVYDPATGVTRDGVQPNGTVNLNSGAESTIHGLLTMQVLDAHPDLAALAQASASIRTRDGLRIVEAETGTVTGPAVTVTPASAWTGESQWSGQYISASAGSTVTWQLPADTQDRLIQPVVELTPQTRARTTFTAGRSPLGDIRYGAVGRQGNAPSPTELTPVPLRRTIGPAATTVTARTSNGTGTIDALLVMPEVATLAADGSGHAVTLLTSKSGSAEHRSAPLGGTGKASISEYDRNGRLVTPTTTDIAGSTATALITPGGFTILTR